MVTQLEDLVQHEKELLLKAPALVSLLAASGDHEINKKQKADAIKLSHLKTFTATPLLIPYYKEVEKNFDSYFEEAAKKYAPFDDEKRQALRTEINVLESVIKKLDKDFARILHASLKGYAEHVRRADGSFMEGFIFPIPIHGLTD
jgi:hypothetical protein